MNIILMNGGLGNQTFQYIFARYIESMTNDICWIDNSHHCVGIMHNGYEMEKVFGLKLNLLSDFYGEEVWHNMMNEVRKGISVPQQMLDNNMKLIMGAETKDYKFKGKVENITSLSLVETLAKLPQNVYFHGYWMDAFWFGRVKDRVISELKFAELESQYNIDILKKIKETQSVSVHVRRGDFLSYGIELPVSYYYNSMKKCSEELENPMFFIFSDNIQWCKDNYKELGFDFSKGNILFVEGNTKENNYIDLQLMSNCKNMIISNSSFSFIASLINQNKDKQIIRPIHK